MILATHAIVGAAVGRLFPAHPIAAFAAGVISHFILDSIPHYDYHLRSVSKNKENRMHDDMVFSRHFARDILVIGFDGAVGAALALYFLYDFNQSWYYFVSLTAGFCGGIIPDALQFAYWKIRREPFVSLQKFHLAIHAKSNYNDYPVFGMMCQIGMVAVVIAATNMVQ